MCQWIFKSIYNGLVVGYTWHYRLELRVIGTGGPRRHHQWLKLIHLDSIASCIATSLILFSVLFVLPIERCHTSMASYKCANQRKIGTIILIKRISYHGPMFLMSPLWSGSKSGTLDLCVLSVIHIPLEISDIKKFALSPLSYGEHR